jgi:hypothetical protein
MPHATSAILVLESGCVEIPVADLISKAESLGFKMTRRSYEPDYQVKPEMLFQPSFKGLVGPMYGGPGVVRYEDGPTYNLLST